MELHVVDHPLVAHKLTVLRDKNTNSQIFRELVDELVTLLAYEATRHIRVDDRPIETPLQPMVGKHLAPPSPIVIPILRAGLGMLSGMTRLLPTAEVGFLGMKRDEETLAVETYANRLPQDLTDRQVFLVDPMLATGGTLVAAINYVLERGARDVTCVCLVGAPQGVQTVKDVVGERANVAVYMAALDEGLNDQAYILPGLGDAGDRLYGIVDA
ncbi:MAG: uracil phosphoribosyltransferase [Varibaculum sp.]|nr:uracil phosphoribosyltransferase [Varibaculum sp.]